MLSGKPPFAWGDCMLVAPPSAAAVLILVDGELGDSVTPSGFMVSGTPPMGGLII